MMLIHVNSNSLVKDLKKQFHDFFPFLKIEFFNKEHSFGQSTHKSNMYFNDKKVFEINPNIKENIIIFNKDTTVFELEKKFNDDLGLNVQVFRKSGTVYIETSLTDSWTLDKQNTEGELLQQLSEIKEPVSDSLDRDVYE